MSDQHKPSSNAVPLRQKGHRTYHLVPAQIWDGHKDQPTYVPEAFGEEGFIHCTDSLEELLAVGNRYYQQDPRAYLALRIDCDRLQSTVVYEDPQHLFPHIYGPLPTDSVEAVLTVERDESGQFLTIR